MPKRHPKQVFRFLRSKEASSIRWPRPLFRRGAFVTVHEKSGFDRHQHLDYQMIYVESGAYQASVNGTKMELGPEDLLVVKPFDWHEEHCLPPLRYYAVNFVLAETVERSQQSEESMGLFREGVAPLEQVAHIAAETMQPLLNQLMEEANRSDALSPALQDGILSQMVLTALREFPDRCLREGLLAQGPDEHFLLRLERMFRQNARHGVSVAEMAAALRMSERSLTARCRRLLQESPARAFLRHRLETAEALLGQTEMSVKEVSGHLGFENPYHFSRAFKRHFGRSPSQVG